MTSSVSPGAFTSDVTTELEDHVADDVNRKPEIDLKADVGKIISGTEEEEEDISEVELSDLDVAITSSDYDEVPEKDDDEDEKAVLTDNMTSSMEELSRHALNAIKRAKEEQLKSVEKHTQVVETTLVTDSQLAEMERFLQQEDPSTSVGSSATETFLDEGRLICHDSVVHEFMGVSNRKHVVMTEVSHQQQQHSTHCVASSATTTAASKRLVQSPLPTLPQATMSATATTSHDGGREELRPAQPRSVVASNNSEGVATGGAAVADATSINSSGNSTDASFSQESQNASSRTLDQPSVESDATSLQEILAAHESDYLDLKFKTVQNTHGEVSLFPRDRDNIGEDALLDLLRAKYTKDEYASLDALVADLVEELTEEELNNDELALKRLAELMAKRLAAGDDPATLKSMEKYLQVR